MEKPSGSDLGLASVPIMLAMLVEPLTDWNTTAERHLGRESIPHGCPSSDWLLLYPFRGSRRVNLAFKRRMTVSGSALLEVGAS
jgi:hypothetical protein